MSSNFFREKIMELVDKFPKLVFLVCIFSACIFLGLYQFVDQDFTPEQYEEAKAQIVNETPDLELCDALHTESREAMDYAEIDDENYSECLNEMNEYQYIMYVLYDFERAMSENGIGTYLYDTDGIFGQEISALLKTLELEEMANYYDTFIQEHDIDFQEFAIDVEQTDMEELYKQYPIEELNEKYNLDAFDEKYAQLNQGDLLLKCLAEYGRANIDQFGWDRISERKLQAELLI